MSAKRFSLATIRSLTNKFWLEALTAAFVALGVYYFFRWPLNELSQLGDFFAGFSATLAFLWLIASFRLQAREIGMQREELKLQRLALENQVKEMKNSAKFTSISQIESILDRATRRLTEGELKVKDASEITTRWFEGMKLWKVLLESTDANLVHDHYMQWIKIEGLARGYVSSVAFALKTYLDHNVEIEYEKNIPDEEFVYIYSGWMYKAPYLTEHGGVAYLVANFLFLYSPGLKAIHAAGMYASSKLVGKDVFKEGALEKLRAELIEKKVNLPRICQ